MFGTATKHSTPLGHPAFFMPTNPSQVQLANIVKSMYIKYRENIGPEHFKSGGLLLLQHETGTFQWTFLDNLFKQEHNVRLYKCSLSIKEADFIVKDRVLFICDDDSRISDFSLLSKAKTPPSCDDAAESIDLVSRHLASKRAVIFYHVDEMGNKIINETNTADYYRAKLDIRLHPENTRNMRRFCNRQGPNGEGPSDLQSRICFGYVKPIKYPSKLTSPFNFSCQLSISSTTNNGSDTDPHNDNDSQLPSARRHSKHSAIYYFMRLTLCSPTRLEAEQHRHDLAHARKEKAPERVPTVPAHWTTQAFKRVRDFCGSRRRRCGSKAKGVEEERIGDELWGGEKEVEEEEEEEEEEVDGLRGEKEEDI